MMQLKDARLKNKDKFDKKQNFALKLLRRKIGY